MNTIYKLLAFRNDVNAVRRGRVARRIGWRVYARATRKIWRMFVK